MEGDVVMLGRYRAATIVLAAILAVALGGAPAAAAIDGHHLEGNEMQGSITLLSPDR
jgi:hypothetical protein